MFLYIKNKSQATLPTLAKNIFNRIQERKIKPIVQKIVKRFDPSMSPQLKT
jgi:hypothetical protein